MKKAISFLLSLVLLFSCLSGVTFPVSAAADTEQASKEKEVKAADVGTIVTIPETGKAYKMAMDKNSGNLLYFNGKTESASVTYRLQTTTNVDEAVDVYLEAANSGYRLYFNDASGNKKYIRVYQRTSGSPGNGKGSLEIVSSAPSEYYYFDIAANTLVYDYDGDNAYYMGTYSSYTTFSVSNTSYITGNNASNVDVTQFPARLYDFSGTEPIPQGLKYTIQNGKARITRYSGSASEVVIPDVIAGCPVTAIGDGAFSGCEELVRVTIPETVTTIGVSAFSDCTSLENLTVPDSVKSIGNYAFENCGSLTEINIPDGVPVIGDYTFYGCSGLETVTIPASVTQIGESAFSGCSSLTGITIPNGVTKLEGYAFSGCTGLKNVTIADGVSIIDENAFSGCTGLESITVPDSVSYIRDYTFSGCTSLKTVTIPDSVGSI